MTVVSRDRITPPNNSASRRRVARDGRVACRMLSIAHVLDESTQGAFGIRPSGIERERRSSSLLKQGSVIGASDRRGNGTVSTLHFL
ncbi:MAG: hypothetical protein JWQ55_2477 [Rhodopila sp.]|jgi:hypothetical protein|nr:hypothetical protein [Rhodopila sp.]